MAEQRVRRVLRGVTAGVVATVAYTATSAQLKRRTGSTGDVQPIQVATALGGGTPPAETDAGHRGLANGLLHWGYGTWGGLLRELLAGRGITGWRADLAQLAAFWLPWRLLALAHRPDHQPTRRQRRDALAADLFKHVVYVLVCRLVHDLLARRR
ncbi:MAG TPA: hypothetical protein VHX38_31140 [Pseudonocardiaceae bacterium]|jgi:hypothetical protein|nr:hypothetical protein [Pseudonocardiaceae bacterium]